MTASTSWKLGCLYIYEDVLNKCVFIQIFSNGNAAHVDKVLSKLGLEDCFAEIICFETLNPTKTSEEPSNSSDGED